VIIELARLRKGRSLAAYPLFVTLRSSDTVFREESHQCQVALGYSM
jgi:hypothetical protein